MHGTAEVPKGTVTFLFTDIEGSTKRWEQQPDAMSVALAEHDALLRDAIECHGGRVFKTVGDAFYAAFPTALPAVEAAQHAQHALYSLDWQQSGLSEPVRVRIALHTGVAEMRDADYFGQALNRVARLLSAGHGGQVLLSESTYELVRDILPASTTMRDLGERRLKDLARPERIYQLVAPGLPDQFPPLKTLDYRPNNLPRQPTALVGREREIEAVRNLVRRPDAYLVTLTGPGGVGKTRLGLQVAADLLDDFVDGVWFVELAALAHHSLVLPTIAQVLGVAEAAGKPLLDNLKEYLHEKQILLLLDNLEQVMEAAPVLGMLLKSAPGLKVIVTSRTVLRVHGEREYPVPPFALPDLNRLPAAEADLVAFISRFDAVRLFVERARDINAEFQITRDNAAAVAGICVRLDGLPLAIELAAARIRLFPPAALLSRLGRRFNLLTSGARDLPARQQTLRKTMEWSYELLTPGEKQFLRRMAVFNGGRTLEALKAVCDLDGALQIDVLDGVESLVNKSLLNVREGSQQGQAEDREPRFWMLETIHEFAKEMLEESGETGALKEAHARYFRDLSVKAKAHLRGAEQFLWLARLDDEYDNLRSALGWTRESDEPGAVTTGLEIAGALFRYWYTRAMYTEGREQYEALLARAAQVIRADPSAGEDRVMALLQAETLLRVGNLTWVLGDYDTARSFLERSLSAYRNLGDKQGTGSALLALGNVALYEPDYPLARSLYEQSLAIHRSLGDQANIASSLHNVGVVAEILHDYPAAQSALQEGLAVRRQLGDKVGIAQILQNLADIKISLGDLASGAAMYAESLSTYWEANYRWGMVEALENLARVAGATAVTTKEIGEVEEAPSARSGVDALSLRRKETESRRDMLLRAARLWAAGDTLRRAIGTPVPPSQIEEYERAIAAVRSGLEPEAWSVAWLEGTTMSLEDIVTFALDRFKQGDPN